MIPVIPLLTVEHLEMRFGGIRALSDVSLSVARDSITGLIGPNGAGKTTVFNCITGFYRPSGGSIQLHSGERPTELTALLGPGWGKGTHRVARCGVARTFQNIRLFKDMTALENLVVAQHRRLNRNLLAGLLQTRDYRRAERAAVTRACEWLKEVDLFDCAQRLAGELPYGHQRRLEIARAMCTQPALICLDEPAAGLNPRETQDLAQLIRGLRERHQVTVLLIEHDMGLVMDICEHIVVLSYGQVIESGNPQTIMDSPVVIEAYLGSPAALEVTA